MEDREHAKRLGHVGGRARRGREVERQRGVGERGPRGDDADPVARLDAPLAAIRARANALATDDTLRGTAADVDRLRVSAAQREQRELVAKCGRHGSGELGRGRRVVGHGRDPRQRAEDRHAHRRVVRDELGPVPRVDHPRARREVRGFGDGDLARAVARRDRELQREPRMVAIGSRTPVDRRDRRVLAEVMHELGGERVLARRDLVTIDPEAEAIGRQRARDGREVAGRECRDLRIEERSSREGRGAHGGDRGADRGGCVGTVDSGVGGVRWKQRVRRRRDHLARGNRDGVRHPLVRRGHRRARRPGRHRDW